MVEHISNMDRLCEVIINSSLKLDINQLRDLELSFIFQIMLGYTSSSTMNQIYSREDQELFSLITSQHSKVTNCNAFYLSFSTKFLVQNVSFKEPDVEQTINRFAVIPLSHLFSIEQYEDDISFQ